MILRELTYAARALARRPVFAISVVVSMALSSGAAASAFTILDSVLIRALPFGNANSLAWVSSVASRRNDAPFSLPEFLDYHDRSRTLDIAAYANWNAALDTDALPQRLQGMRISANAFDVLGATASLGRVFRASDDAPDANPVVLLSHSLWQRQFGGSPAVVGSTIRVNGEPYTVVGVMPRHFPLPLPGVDVVVPLRPGLDPKRDIRNSVNFLRLFGRIRAGASLSSAQQELSAIQRDLKSRFPTEYASKLGVRITPMRDYLVGSSRLVLLLVFGSVALLLVIALANVANLLLIRSMEREGETAVRRAIGASALRIAGLTTAEAGLLVGSATMLASILANWILGAVASMTWLGIPRLDEVRFDGGGLLFLLGVSILATVLFSIVPLVSALRAPTQLTLRAAGRSGLLSRGQARLRDTFMIAQTAFAVIVTTEMVAMARSLAEIQRLPLGYRPDSVFIARISLPAATYQSSGDLARFEERLHRELTADPMVVSAGAVSVAPLTGLLRAVPFRIVGRPAPDDRDVPVAHFRSISPDYLTTVGAALRTGRLLSSTDDENSVRVALVSQALADQYLGPNPVGQQLMVNDNNEGPRPLTVVGVVRNMRHVDLEGPPTFDIFVPLAQVHRDDAVFVAASQFWAVRLRSARADFREAFVRVLMRTDRNVALSTTGSLRDYVDRATAVRRFTVRLLAVFVGMAVLLAGLGVYAVSAYSVEQRRREIGLRLALGATPGGVVGLVLRRTLGAAGIAALIGTVGALAAGRLMTGLLYGVSHTDPAPLAAVIGLVVLTSAAAGWIPARRAARTDPLVAIHS